MRRTCTAKLFLLLPLHWIRCLPTALLARIDVTPRYLATCVVRGSIPYHYRLSSRARTHNLHLPYTRPAQHIPTTVVSRPVTCRTCRTGYTKQF